MIFHMFFADLLMQVLSRSGKVEVLTNPHRPYGSNKASLQEIKRVRDAGGWVCFSIHFLPFIKKMKLQLNAKIHLL
jgi:hypothetical protein